MKILCPHLLRRAALTTTATYYKSNRIITRVIRSAWLTDAEQIQPSKTLVYGTDIAQHLWKTTSGN